MTTATVRIPPKLIPVFTRPARYRGAYGGRGSAKTRTFAKMAAVEAYRRSQAGEIGIILCGREFMNSLDESSMAEVKHAIMEEPWLAQHFEIGERFIRTVDRRVEFKFAGLRHNIDSLKSKARILILWVDEAEPVSRAAWNKIMPTVREEGSEIWVTWNPEKENSPTDEFFRKNPPPDSIIVEINYEDNPWFPDVLREQMEWDRERDPTKYAHIWRGEYLKHSDAIVFHNWRAARFETPDDVERFYFGADWGFSVDPTVLVRMWIDGRTLYIDREAYKVGCEIENTPALFAGDSPYERGNPKHWDNPYGWRGIEGARKWPIVADSARPETISHMRKKGFNIVGAKKGAGSVEEGVEFLKNYDIVIHAENCPRTIDEFSTYSYKIDKQTEEVLPVLSDKQNHVIDSCIAEGELIKTACGEIPVERVKVGDYVLTRNGYRAVEQSGLTRQNAELINVCASGRTLLVTPEHLVYVVNKGFTRADALRYNDEVYIIVEREAWTKAKLKFKSTMELFSDAIRIPTSLAMQHILRPLSRVLGRHTYTDMFGLRSAARYLMGTTSTTLTAIRQTMPLKTLSASAAKSTKQGINGQRKDTKHKSITLKKYAPLHRLGISPKREGGDTRKLALSLLNAVTLVRKHAINADQSLRNAFSASLNAFARMLASLRGAGRLALMMLNANALNAARHLPLINTAQAAHVRARVQTVSVVERCANVYDIAVKQDPEFFASGILVHNCRYGLESLRRAAAQKKPDLNIGGGKSAAIRL